MAKLFANSGDPDQILHAMASDLGLHCLPVTLLRVSRLQLVNFIHIFVTSQHKINMFSRLLLQFKGDLKLLFNET